MSQINFRVNNDEKKVIKALAESKGISIAEFTKDIVLDNISPIRVDLAFNLLKEGKCGRKRSWILSGLTYYEFMLEWTKRGAVEYIPAEIMDESIEKSLDFDLNKYRK